MRDSDVGNSMIVEVLSRMPYEEFLATRLFQPLGMKDTTFHPTAEQVGRLAKSYRPIPNPPGMEEVTIAGNLRDMLRSIVAVGADAYTSGTRTTGSLLVERMKVAGS
jgi:CubicO group peptidase (beta-lactamase class C family)